mmetsp:Transcript_40917/g.49653  ORF Transcript_40917/g.49653 Transcript_40917/m.49653 type:complete len:103 (+) Transcript_40917:170-478(+)|eukprot:CAMPEP_0197852164 /NCGR_PEP_ID=MMETSP1438-20131217/19809_1 /TAXON_ID=1461541 /ORGANISM="Pterosperma sp., Strain CCMP1384" /LENGTH=102 /DNA_ID=CAMNT_0043466053 /DNA_START=170 /DNA_END=478 /DNA_ORIENTATION=+
MDPQQLEAFEARAAEAERRLSALEAYSHGGGEGPGGDDLKVKMLEMFLDLRQQLGKAKCDQQALQAEKDKYEAKSMQLEKENSKLKYQVSHLIKSIRDGEAK